MKTIEQVKLEHLMAERLGSITPSEFPNEEFDLYSIPAFDRGVPEITRGNEIGSAKQIVAPGDVLLSKIVPHIRRSWVVGKDRGKRIIASGEWIVFRGDRFDPEYLKHVLTSDTFHIRFMETVAGVGGSLLRARPSQVAEIKIPLPPLPEQRRIAAILDKADAIRRKREEGIRLTEELLRSTFLEMFGDPATNPKGWNMVKVGEALATERHGMRCGPFGTALRKDEYVPTGIPVWGIENISPNQFKETGSLFITDDKYQELTSYSVEPGDVLISRAGTVGRMCVAHPRQTRSIIGTNLIRVALNQSVLSPDYFTALFTYFSDRVAGLRASSDDGAYSFMQTGVLKEVRVPLPPIQRQKVYATFVAIVRKNQATRLSAAIATDRLFGSLVQRAFRGEL